MSATEVIPITRILETKDAIATLESLQKSIAWRFFVGQGLNPNARHIEEQLLIGPLVDREGALLRAEYLKGLAQGLRQAVKLPADLIAAYNAELKKLETPEPPATPPEV